LITLFRPKRSGARHPAVGVPALLHGRTIDDREQRDSWQTPRPALYMPRQSSRTGPRIVLKFTPVLFCGAQPESFGHPHQIGQ
jgi:hypothetical protein